MGRKDEPSTIKQAALAPRASSERADAAGEVDSGHRVGAWSENGSREKVALARPSFGRYEILFEIARGGMGVVYAARSRGERGVERLVALKTLPREAAGSDDFESFVNEARITARLNHPNIVDTFELCLDEAEPYLVMRLIEGVPFSDVVRRATERGVPLDATLVAFIGRQVALGLHAAHELSTSGTTGLVHRDVSPQNILLSYDGRVYLADFGVAKLLGGARSTANGVVKGKFSYMSPEQARAERLDRRSDIFSLGAVLYEALTLKQPFSSDSPAGAIFRVLNESPAPLRQSSPGLSEKLDRIVMKCLAKDRESRFATADVIADELREFLREAGAFVDEKDVERLLLNDFSERRDAWRARFADNELSPIDASVPKVPALEDAAPIGPNETMSHTVARLPGLEPRRWIARAAIGLFLVGGIVGLFTLAAKKSDPPSTTTATEDHREKATPPPIRASDTEPVSAEPFATTSAPTSSTSSVPRVLAPVRAPAPTVSVPLATPSSHRGQPFRDLP